MEKRRKEIRWYCQDCGYAVIRITKHKKHRLKSKYYLCTNPKCLKKYSEFESDLLEVVV